MFDGNPLTAKFYLQDLERQVAAARRSRGILPVSEKTTRPQMRSERFVEQYGRILARAFAGLARGGSSTHSAR